MMIGLISECCCFFTAAQPGMSKANDSPPTSQPFVFVVPCAATLTLIFSFRHSRTSKNSSSILCWRCELLFNKTFQFLCLPFKPTSCKNICSALCNGDENSSEKILIIDKHFYYSSFVLVNDVILFHDSLAAVAAFSGRWIETCSHNLPFPGAKQKYFQDTSEQDDEDKRKKNNKHEIPMS